MTDVPAPHIARGADRRSFLASGAASIVAASAFAPAVVAAATPRAEWDVAMARYQAAVAAFEPYENSFHIAHDIRAELGASYRNLMNTPAPDGAALKWKLKEILEDAEEDCALADAFRLLGSAA